jgi:hypothetical protein
MATTTWERPRNEPVEGEDQVPAMVRHPDGGAPYRTTARVVGALFLAGIVVYLAGNGLVQSVLGAPDHLSAVPASSMLLAFGALLMLLPAAWDAAHGILMLPVLKQHSERVAFGYLGSRIVDAVFLAVGVLFLLLQIPLGREYLKAGIADAPSFQALSTLSIQASQYAYQISQIAVGLAGVMLCYGFYRAKLVPRLVALWGLAGYALLFCGMVLEILGFHLSLILSVPGGLFELFIGVWLIAKGFTFPAFAPKRAAASGRKG